MNRGIGPGKSALGDDAEAVVGEACEIERLGNSARLARKQRRSERKALRINARTKIAGPHARLGGGGDLDPNWRARRDHHRDANGSQGGDIDRRSGFPISLKRDAVLAVGQRERKPAIAVRVLQQPQAPAFDHHAGSRHSAAGGRAHCALDAAEG